MPARKPKALTNWHETKEQSQAREAAEAATTPKTNISIDPPSALKGHKQAAVIWRETVGLFLEIDGSIVTAFDTNVLIEYCLIKQELPELIKLRAEIRKLWETHSKWLAKFKPKSDQLKDYFNALAQANALLQRYQGVDARLDNKRKILVTISQSLYLTPRSRAGVAPTEKTLEAPHNKSAMASLLEEYDHKLGLVD